VLCRTRRVTGAAWGRGHSPAAAAGRRARRLLAPVLLREPRRCLPRAGSPAAAAFTRCRVHAPRPRFKTRRNAAPHPALRRRSPYRSALLTGRFRSLCPRAQLRITANTGGSGGAAPCPCPAQASSPPLPSEPEKKPAARPETAVTSPARTAVSFEAEAPPSGGVRPPGERCAGAWREGRVRAGRPGARPCCGGVGSALEKGTCWKRSERSSAAPGPRISSAPGAARERGGWKSTGPAAPAARRNSTAGVALPSG